MPFTSRNGLSVYVHVREREVSVASSSIHLVRGMPLPREGRRHVISHIDRILLLIRKREEEGRRGILDPKTEEESAALARNTGLSNTFRQEKKRKLWEPNLIPREDGGRGGDKLFFRPRSAPPHFLR